MTQKQQHFWKNFWEFIVYSLVGLATTFVSYGIRSLILYTFAPLNGIDLNSTDPAMVGASSALRSVAQTAGWVAGVLFAFLPNKVLVFRDRTWGARHVLFQFGAFAVSRVGTYFLELGLAVLLPISLNHFGYRAFRFVGVDFYRRHSDDGDLHHPRNGDQLPDRQMDRIPQGQASDCRRWCVLRKMRRPRKGTLTRIQKEGVKKVTDFFNTLLERKDNCRKIRGVAPFFFIFARSMRLLRACGSNVCPTRSDPRAGRSERYVRSEPPFLRLLRALPRFPPLFPGWVPR